MTPELPPCVHVKTKTSPVKFYKGGSQEKTLLLRPEFFLLPSPRDGARVLTCRAMVSVCRAQGPSDLGFFYQRFSSPIATKPISSETRKAERWSGANHGSIGDSWPMAFSGCPRGPRVGCETKCPRHICLTSRLRLALEPECLDEPTATAREDPRDGADSIRNTQAACGFRYWASKRAPFFQRCKVIAAIFRASVRRAISGWMPLASSAA